MSVVQSWAEDRCSLCEQGVLMAAVRGPDGEINHPIKPWVRFVRQTVLRSGRHSKFMVVEQLQSIYAIHEATPLDALPVHFYAHLMHALQVIAVRHPTNDTALSARMAYRAMVSILHLKEESDLEMIERLQDDVHRVGLVELE